MRLVNTDDLKKIMGEDGFYKGHLIKDLNEEETIECFGAMLRSAFEHSMSRHYQSFLDEPRY